MSERTIFLTALEFTNPNDRAAYLDAACEGNPALRREVEALLRSHDSAGSFLETPAQPGSSSETPTQFLSAQSQQPPETPDAVAAVLELLAPSDRPDARGRIGHYDVLEVLGHGAFGVVLRAFDSKLHRIVAIKAMNPEMAATSPPRKRFLREARSAAAVKHEHIVSIYSVEEEPLPYLVMEYVSGKTLQTWLDEHGPLEPLEVVQFGRQIAAGLAAAHAQGLIHRDIKPANILLESGLETRAKITDFGLARAADDASLTQSGLIAGTPLYMAPEQAKGQPLDSRADLFSLGSVLYTMLSGRPPFRAPNTIAVLRRVCEDTPRAIGEVIPGTPPWLCDIIAKLHAKEPADRFQSATEVVQALDAGLAYLKDPQRAPQPAVKVPVEAAEKPVAKAAWTRTQILLTSLIALGLLPFAGCLLVVVAMVIPAWQSASQRGEVLPAANLDPYHRVVEQARQEVETNRELFAAKRVPLTTLIKAEIGLTEAEFKLAEAQQDWNRQDELLSLLVEQHRRLLDLARERSDAKLIPKSDVVAAEVDVQTVEARQQRLRATHGEKLLPRSGLRSLDLAQHGKFVNPRQDCRLSFSNTAATSTARITVPGTGLHDLNPTTKWNNFDAPRVLVDVLGDFIVQVKVLPFETSQPKTALREGFSYRGAGLMVWQNDQTLLRHERASAGEIKEGRPHLQSEWFAEKEQLDLRYIPTIEGPVYLQIERQGHRLWLRWSDDARQWHESAEVKDLDLSDKLQVGLVAINATSQPLEAVFEDFRLQSTPFNSIAPATLTTSWQPLFNGRDLAGWQPNDHWKVENGVLVSRVPKNASSPPSMLVTERNDYRDFHVRLEAKLNHGGDSGFFFRFGDQGKSALQAQLTAGPTPLGSILSGPDTIAVSDRTVPHDVWFTLEVIAKGPEISVLVQGQPVVLMQNHGDRGEAGPLAIESGFAGTEVMIRKLEVRAAPQRSPGSSDDPVVTPDDESRIAPRILTAGERTALVWAVSHGGRVVTGKGELRGVDDIPADLNVHHTTESAQNAILSLDLVGPAVNDEAIDTLVQLPPVGQLALLNCSLSDRSLTRLLQAPCGRNAMGLIFVNTLRSANALSVIATFPKLQFLQINPCPPLTPELIRSWNRLPLNRLELTKARLSNDEFAAIGKLSGLRMLELTVSGVDDAALMQLQSLSGLESLYIARQSGQGDTTLTDDGLSGISRFENLSILDLRQHDVSDTGLKHLTACRQLTTVMLEGTRVTETGVNDLARALPRAKISWSGGIIAPQLMLGQRDRPADAPLQAIDSFGAARTNDSALEFDGVDDHVEIPTLRLEGLPEFTVEARFRQTLEPGQKGTILAGLSDPLFALDVNEHGQLSGYLMRGRLPTGVFGPKNMDQAWHHVAATVSGGKVALYLDGKPLPIEEPSFAVVTDDVNVPRNRFLIGAGQAWNVVHLIYPFRGAIDELRLSRTIRHRGEYQPSDRLDADEETLALYHFDEGRGTALTDASGHGHHGLIVGATWIDGPTQPASSAGIDLLNHPVVQQSAHTGKGLRLENGALIFTSSEADGLAQVWIDKLKTRRGRVRAVLQAMDPLPQGVVSVGWDYAGGNPRRVDAVLHAPQGTPTASVWEFGPNFNVTPLVDETIAVDLSQPIVIEHEFHDGEVRATIAGRTVTAKLSANSDRQAFPYLGVKGTWKLTEWRMEDLEGAEPAATTDAPPPAIAPFDAAAATAHQEAWAKHLGVPVEYTNSIGMKFRLIPPGEFTMGSTPEEIEAALKDVGEDKHWQECIQSEAPRHKVLLTQPIYLGVNEVTQAEYEKVMGVNPSHFAPMGMGKEAVAGLETTEHPVEMVSWNDAAEFCAKLSKQEKLKPFYFRAGETITPLDGSGYRLPSEAEWEFACRAGTTTKYWIGDKDEDLVRAGWFGGNSGGRTHAAGELKSNPFGLSDIHGNVWEWVQDGWDASYYSQFPDKPAINPNSPFSAGSQRVFRGGNWYLSASVCRSANRNAGDPSYRNLNIGFRVSLPVDAVRAELMARTPAVGTISAPPAAIAPFDAAQATAHQEAWAKHLGVPVEYTNSIGMKFRLIPPGEFLMGSTPEEIETALKEIDGDQHWQECLRSEAPRHKVRLTQAIYLGVNEVTQAEYARLMGLNPSEFHANGAEKDAVVGLDTTNHPVESVTWNDAAEFCAELSRRETLKPFYLRAGGTITPLEGTGYRLPTEAEWEFACRAGTTTRFWSGDADESLVGVGWSGAAAGGRTHAVGELKPNPFGLFDVHGNVWEWVQDGWDASQYRQFPDQAAIDPSRLFIDRPMRSLRGGRWGNYPAAFCRSSFRHARDPSHQGHDIGFRVALTVEAVRASLAGKVSGNQPQSLIAPEPQRLELSWIEPEYAALNRRAAEAALNAGGSVQGQVIDPTNGRFMQDFGVNSATALPVEPFILKSWHLKRAHPGAKAAFAAVAGLRHLDELVFHATTARGVELSHLREARSLWNFGITTADWQTSRLAELTNRSALRVLWLHARSVDDEGASLAGCSALRVIWCDNSDAAINLLGLATAPGLRYIFLTKPVTEEAVAAVQAAHPRLQIVVAEPSGMRVAGIDLARAAMIRLYERGWPIMAAGGDWAFQPITDRVQLDDPRWFQWSCGQQAPVELKPTEQDWDDVGYFQPGGLWRLRGHRHADAMARGLAAHVCCLNLDLSNSTLTDEGLAALQSLTALRTLYVTGCPVSEAAIQAFHRAHPEILLATSHGNYGFRFRGAATDEAGASRQDESLPRAKPSP